MSRADVPVNVMVDQFVETINNRLKQKNG